MTGFVPAPGHGPGFNKCPSGRIRGETVRLLDFVDGLRIELTVKAIARSAETGTWETVAGTPRT